MTNFKKNVTNGDVRDNLVNWIKEGIGFSTPIRDTGMMTTRGYYGGLRTSSVSGSLYKKDNGRSVYVVYSYETPIMRVHFLDVLSNGVNVPVSAEIDNRKYSATTANMQGWCISALRDLFGLPYMPPVVGKRGGLYSRHNFMMVTGNYLKGYEWGVLDHVTGEIVKINQKGDPYNGDTEGYFE